MNREKESLTEKIVSRGLTGIIGGAFIGAASFLLIYIAPIVQSFEEFMFYVIMPTWIFGAAIGALVGFIFALLIGAVKDYQEK